MFSLNPVSRMIAQAALSMGGGYAIWYSAIPCPGKRRDGSPCFDEDYGSSWIECSICSGEGTVWKKNRTIKTVYTDNANPVENSDEGFYLLGSKTLSVDPDLALHLLKTRYASSGNSATRRILMDKFILLDVRGKEKEVLYLDNSREPVLPSINNTEIYAIVYVKNNT